MAPYSCEVHIAIPQWQVKKRRCDALQRILSWIEGLHFRTISPMTLSPWQGGEYESESLKRKKAEWECGHGRIERESSTRSAKDLHWRGHLKTNTGRVPHWMEDYHQHRFDTSNMKMNIQRKKHPLEEECFLRRAFSFGRLNLTKRTLSLGRLILGKKAPYLFWSKFVKFWWTDPLPVFIDYSL